MLNGSADIRIATHRESVHSVLRGGIDRTASVWLTAGDRSKVDDMTRVLLLEVW